MVEITHETAVFNNHNVDDTQCDVIVTPFHVTFLSALALHPQLSTTRIDRLNHAIIMNYQRIETELRENMRKGKEIYARCREAKFSRHARNVGDPIRLVRMSGTFGIMLIGVAAAAGIFICEQIVHKYKHYAQVAVCADTALEQWLSSNTPVR